MFQRLVISRRGNKEIYLREQAEESRKEDLRSTAL